MVLAAITQAMATGWILPSAIFHSDPGCQYSAAATRHILQHFELRQSMSAKGYCYDNAFTESACATLKTELPGDGRPFNPVPTPTSHSSTIWRPFTTDADDTVPSAVNPPWPTSINTLKTILPR